MNFRQASISPRIVLVVGWQGISHMVGFDIDNVVIIHWRLQSVFGFDYIGVGVLAKGGEGETFAQQQHQGSQTEDNDQEGQADEEKDSGDWIHRCLLPRRNSIVR